MIENLLLPQTPVECIIYSRISSEKKVEKKLLMAELVCHEKKMKNGVGAPIPHFHQSG